MEIETSNRPASKDTQRGTLPRLPYLPQRNGKKAKSKEGKILEGEGDDKSSTKSRETSPVRSSGTEESSKAGEPEKIPQKGIFWRPKTNLTKSIEPTDASAIEVVEESGIEQAQKTATKRNKKNKSQSSKPTNLKSLEVVESADRSTGKDNPDQLKFTSFFLFFQSIFVPKLFFSQPVLSFIFFRKLLNFLPLSIFYLEFYKSLFNHKDKYKKRTESITIKPIG